MLVSKFEFLDVGILGDINAFWVCFKNGFFRSCFQQSAKRKMTHKPKKTLCFQSKLNCMIVFAINTSIYKLPSPSPFVFSLSNNSF